MIFSWKRIFKIVGIIVLAGLVAAGIYFFVTWRPVKIVWASLIYDRRENFVDCQHLPFYPQVEKAFLAHGDIVQKVRQIPGVENFYFVKIECKIYDGGTTFLKGQGELEYKKRSAKNSAEKIIGNNFFGIPYRGYPD
jgi:hypothetical protein